MILSSEELFIVIKVSSIFSFSIFSRPSVAFFICLWYHNGQFHRTDGPAIIYPSGSQEWWLYGKRHRTDGPAIIWINGGNEWWLNGQLISYTQKKFENYLIQQNLNHIL